MIESVIKANLMIWIAGGIGLYFYRQYTAFFRIQTLQVLLAIITTVPAIILMYQSNNNQWVYNIYVLVEGFLLLYAAYLYFKNSKIKKMVVSFAVIFVIAYLLQVLVLGFDKFVNYTFILEGVMLMVLYLIIMFRSVNRESSEKKIRPEFWVSLGVLVYFACNSPHFGILHYLDEYYPQLNTTMFLSINDTLSLIRYLLAAVGLYLGAGYYREAIINE